MLKALRIPWLTKLKSITSTIWYLPTYTCNYYFLHSFATHSKTITLRMTRLASTLMTRQKMTRQKILGLTNTYHLSIEELFLCLWNQERPLNYCRPWKSPGQVCVQELIFYYRAMGSFSLSSPQSVSTQETPYNPVAPIIPLLSALLATFSKLFSLGSCQAMKEKLTTMSRELSCLATGPQFNSDLLQVLSNGIDNVKPVSNVVCHL